MTDSELKPYQLGAGVVGLVTVALAVVAALEDQYTVAIGFTIIAVVFALVWALIRRVSV
jgi:hypothetical protein